MIDPRCAHCGYETDEDSLSPVEGGRMYCQTCFGAYMDGVRVGIASGFTNGYNTRKEEESNA